MSCTIQIPSLVHAGRGSIDSLSDIVARDHVKCVVLFTDKGVRNVGLCERVLTILTEHGISCGVFDSVVTEPSIYDVDRIMKDVSDVPADLLLAIGGGSSMDTAKLASVLMGASYTVFDLVNDASLG